MTIAITWIFRDGPGLRSWSETHYDPGASDFAKYITFSPSRGPQSTPVLDTWIERRMALIPRPGPVGGPFPNPANIEQSIQQAVFLAKIRFSVLSGAPGPIPARNSYTLYLAGSLPSYPGKAGTYIPVFGEVAELYTRLLVSVRTTSPVNGRMFLGGIPDDQIIAPETMNLDGQWGSRLDALLIYLRTIAIGIRSRRVGGAPPQQVVPITSFTVAASGMTAQLQPAGLLPGLQQIPPNGQVVITGRHPSEWNGSHRYLLVSPPAPGLQYLLLGPARRPLGDFVPATNPQGYVSLAAPQFPTIAGGVPERIVSRDTGGPFVRYRGRRVIRD